MTPFIALHLLCNVVFVIKCVGYARADSQTWNNVLQNSCPAEFDPSGSTLSDAEKAYIGMWVGHEYSVKLLREADFTAGSVSAFNSHPWAEATACGRMVNYTELSDGCKQLIREEDGKANCFDWLSFGGTQYKTTSFESLTQSTTGFECLDRQDCCKFTPKAGPALLWADSAPYDDFSNSSLSEYIPGRFPQHRMKYLANTHPKWHRRLQGANPCAEHGRHHVRNLDPEDCTIGASADLQARALGVLQERQHVDPDWQDEPFYKNRYPARQEFGNADNNIVYSDVSMWKVQDEDLDTWQNATSSTDDVVRDQRFHPVLDYGAPNLLHASWEDTASMDPDHIGRATGVSNEWQSMQEALGNERNFKIVADGGLDAECHSIPVVDATVSCAAATKAPNMWDLSHKIYTVYKLPDDTFAHGCVDAEFPHFPYAHYVEFSRKFYEWLDSWNWDHSSMPNSPRDACLQRYRDELNATGLPNLKIDACACDAIVTDCHVNAVSPGEGEVENSSPFNVFNSAGAYRPPQNPDDRKEWWNAASKEFSWRHEFPKQHEQDNAAPSPSMGVEGLDVKYARGKYPRELWPWDRPDPHDDASALDWAKPALWDGVSDYNGMGKLNTSIYEFVIGQQFGEHWWPIANFEFPNFLHYYRASLVKLQIKQQYVYGNINQLETLMEANLQIYTPNTRFWWRMQVLEVSGPLTGAGFNYQPDAANAMPDKRSAPGLTVNGDVPVNIASASNITAYYGLDLSGKLFPALAPNDWWFAKLKMWHESLWFWNPKATHGSGATPAHFPARFANETCFADMLHSYDEHIWRPMIIDDPLTGGEYMASKPVFTNSYSVGFGDINLGINMRSEFLDSKWRSLLSEIDMTYRNSEDLSSELDGQPHENLTVCDWRNSYSDGSKMYSFPLPWPVKPGHVSDFYIANTLEAALEYTGAITQSSWVAANYLMLPQTLYTDESLGYTADGDALYGSGSNVITASDAIRRRFLDEHLLEWAETRLAAGQSLPVGIRPAEGRTSPKTVIEQVFKCKGSCTPSTCTCLTEGFICNETSKKIDVYNDTSTDPPTAFTPTGCKNIGIQGLPSGLLRSDHGVSADNSAYAFTRTQSGNRGVQTDLIQRPMFDDWENTQVPRRFTAAHTAAWNMDFMDGLHHVPDFPQLWWRRFRDFRLAETRKLYVFDNPKLCFGSDLRDEIHYVETEVGRVKESYNTMTDSMHGIYAGIVDAELKLNPSMQYWNEWWNEFRGFRFDLRWNSRHTWPGLIGNVYSTCDASSPHPFCNAQDNSSWTQNFRNFPLIMNGVESNMRHHRRYQPLLWGAQREKDHFLHYPHGGRTDSRFQTPNAVDDLEVYPQGMTIKAGQRQLEGLFGQKFKWGSFYPDMHYSHMLNYDYWKLDLPYEWPPHSKVRPVFQSNPIRKYVPTWEKFNHIGGHMDHKWDCGIDWLDDYTYYAEVVGDDSEDWWGKGMREPSNGDAEIPQPKVYRSFTKSEMTMLEFERNVTQYAVARDSGLYSPVSKYGWAVDDGSGDQVFGAAVSTSGSALTRRRKFGKILKLRENGLLTDFNTLPGHVQRDGVYPESWNAKYSEPSFEARPFMATFDTNTQVNQGAVIRNVNREILSQQQIDFCSSEAVAHFGTRGIPMDSNDGMSAPVQDVGGLSGGAFYDRTQNTLLTPANIFWARFNRVRNGGPSAIHHEDGSVLSVTHQDGSELVKLLDVFGNSESWIDRRYTLLDDKWVKKGLGEDPDYRIESERSMAVEPDTGWTPSDTLKAWRNNVGPTTSLWPEDNDLQRPDSFGENFRGPKYADEAGATRRTAFWFNIERKWKVCKYDSLKHLRWSPILLVVNRFQRWGPCVWYAQSREKDVDVERRADIDFVDVKHPGSDTTNRVLAFGFPPTHIAYQSLQLGIRPGGEGYRAVIDCKSFLTPYLAPNISADWRECHNTAIEALDGCNDPTGARDPYPPPDPDPLPQPQTSPSPEPDEPLASPEPQPDEPLASPEPQPDEPLAYPDPTPSSPPPPSPPPPSPPPYSLFPACFPTFVRVNSSYNAGRLQVDACSDDATSASFDLCDRVSCATDSGLTVGSISTRGFTSATGLHCIQAVTTINTAVAAYSRGPVAVELLFMPMCPDPVPFQTRVTIKRAVMIIGTASLDILGSDIGIDLSGSSPHLLLDFTLVTSSNVDSIRIVNGNAFMTMLMNVTDVSRGSTVLIPAHAYTDLEGNPGAENKTLTLPPIPTVNSRTGQSARAIASVSVAATATSAILSGAAGGASGPGIGRSVANLQFYAWTTGIAVPHLPNSYKDLVNALRWSTVIPKPPSDNIDMSSESAAVGAGDMDLDDGTLMPEEAEQADEDEAQPIVAADDVYRTLTFVTVAFACLCWLHAVVFYGARFAPRLLGRTIKLPDIAAPPRAEIFVLLLLIPSAIFVTQAGYSSNGSVQALASLCLLIAALMTAFGLGWVVIDQLLVKRNVRFVTLMSGTSQTRRLTDTSDRLVLSAKRKSSHGGFLVERDLPNQARPSQFGGSSIGQLATDDIDSTEADDICGISATPARRTMQLFAEAQGATRRVWGSSVGPNIAAEFSTTDMQSNTISVEGQHSHAIGEGLEHSEESQSRLTVRIGDMEAAAATNQADASDGLLEDKATRGKQQGSRVVGQRAQDSIVLDDDVVGSNSLPQVEDGVTMGILGDANQQRGSQNLQDRAPDPCAGLAGPENPLNDGGLPAHTTETAETLAPQEHSLLISAVQGNSKPSAGGQVNDAAACDLELTAKSVMSVEESKTGSVQAPAGFTLVMSDSEVAMFEKKQGFVKRFGIFFQDSIGRSPQQAMKRMRPKIVVGPMISFMHKCALAFVFGNWSRYQKSWTQLGLLVSIHSAYGLYQAVVRPFADKVQQAIEVVTISCQVLLFVCFANMMEPSDGAGVAESLALGCTLCGLVLMMVSDVWQLVTKLRKVSKKLIGFLWNNKMQRN